jgi:hypothetical protein
LKVGSGGCGDEWSAAGAMYGGLADHRRVLRTVAAIPLFPLEKQIQWVHARIAERERERESREERVKPVN